MYALNAEIRFTEKVSLMQNGHFAVVAKGFGESLLTTARILICDDILDTSKPDPMPSLFRPTLN